MGIAMIATAILWSLSPNRVVRIALFAVATVAVAMTTPLVREAAMLAALARRHRGLYPAAARPHQFRAVSLGRLSSSPAASPASSCSRHRANHGNVACTLGCLIAGLAGIALAYAASFRPSIYPVANFWTSSPTFFFIRLGICTAMMPIACGVDRFHAFLRRRFAIGAATADVPGRVVTTLGRSSLFVYWIHVEMAYGGIAKPLKRALPLEVSLVATVALCALLYAIVKWKDRKMAGRELTGAWRIFAPVLK